MIKVHRVIAMCREMLPSFKSHSNGIISDMLPGTEEENWDWFTIPNKTRKWKLEQMWVDLNSFCHQMKWDSITEFWLIYWHSVTTKYRGHIMVCRRPIPLCVHACVFFFHRCAWHFRAHLVHIWPQGVPPLSPPTHVHTVPTHISLWLGPL